MSESDSATDREVEHASGVETRLLASLLDNVKECSDLQPAEKETVFTLARDQDHVRVYTESRAFMSSLLMHPDFEVTEIRECGPDCEHPPYGTRHPPDGYSGGAVTGLKGTLDVGALKITETARRFKNHSRVVSDGVRDNDPREHGGGDSP